MVCICMIIRGLREGDRGVLFEFGMCSRPCAAFTHTQAKWIFLVLPEYRGSILSTMLLILSKLHKILASNGRLRKCPKMSRDL
jgi:hypothetical protein